MHAVENDLLSHHSIISNYGSYRTVTQQNRELYNGVHACMYGSAKWLVIKIYIVRLSVTGVGVPITNLLVVCKIITCVSACI